MTNQFAQFTRNLLKKRFVWMIAFLLVTPLGITRLATDIFADGTPCANPGTTSRQYSSSQNSPVNVVLNSSQFSPTQLNCLKAAFDNWNTAKGSNRSNVTFNVT